MSAHPRGGDGLGALVRSLRALQQHAESNPLDYWRWHPHQLDYLRSTARRKLLRTGNRGGKSVTSLADCAWIARKQHPYRPDWNARRGPTKQWIVGVSWDQLIPLMRIFRSFLSPTELRSQPNWTDAKGWGKDSPTLIWPDGSMVTWKTTGQQERMHAGAELDHVLVDEPCSDENYRELERRVVSRAGFVSLSLTPVNAPGPLDWLRDLCTEGVVQDLHYGMTEDLFRFADTGELRALPDGTLLDQTWIDQQAREVLPRWRNIVLHGDWDEIVVDGEFTDTFRADAHVADFTLDGVEVLSLGNDHGTRGYAETAVLIAVDTRPEYPHVYVVDEYEAAENTSSENDARGIVEMLGQHRWRGERLQWKHLKHATGDIPHYGGRGRASRKSNVELSYELCKATGLGRHEALSPPLRQAKSGKGSSPRGSVIRGLSWIHRALLRPGQFTIHPRCVGLIKSMETYKGGSEDPAGHLVDALRYALDPWIVRGQTRNVATPNVRF